jgi:hypothetical protein
MKNLIDLFKNLRRLDLKDKDIQDSLYRISDWLSNEEHTEKDDYVQNQLSFLNNLIKDSEYKNKYYSANKCE